MAMEMGSMVAVVEDDPGIRRSLCMVMESANLSVQVFESAEEFLGSGAAGQSLCLILDLRLPGMSGLELLEQLRQRQDLTPAIMISGHGDIPAVVRGMKLGVVDFLEKPVNHDVLLGRVRAVLAAERSRRERSEEIQRLRADLRPLRIGSGKCSGRWRPGNPAK